MARAGWSPRGPLGLFVLGGAVMPAAGGGSPYGWATAGIEVHYGQVGSPRRPDATGPPPPTLRIHAPAATSVEVVGSVNDWSAEPLHPGAGGEVTRRQPDGFGGENGVIEAP